MRNQAVEMFPETKEEGKNNFGKMVDLSPINTLMATPEGVMTYMNENSRKTLETLAQYLPDKVDNLVGNSIDWFHKVPEHQRGIIKNASNLPYQATIDVGPEKLDLLVSAITSNDGEYLGPMVTWEVVTQKLETEREMQRTQEMVDKSPVNTLMATPEGIMTYMNENSRKTLETLAKFLPDKVDNLVGKSIDWFHKVPEHQRGIIKNASNLPYQATIDVGPEKLDLLVSPVSDASGNYLGPMVTWEVVTQKLETEREMQRTQEMVDKSPVNTLMATPEGIMTYMNENSRKTLETLAKFLPDKVDNLVGKSIDWFHKVPEHQRGIIKNASNLPYQATIDVGPEKLDLLVSPVSDASGEYLGPMVTWEVVTQKLLTEREMQRTQEMVDKSPVNTLMATPEGIMTYMNENSRKTLETLSEFLPDKVDNLVGKSIDWFHKNPEHQRGIIKNASNLPYKATIDVGPEKLDLLVSPVSDASGNYLGPMVTWEVVTQKLLTEREMQRTQEMVDKSPVNTMMATPEGLMIYMNNASKTTLRTLEQFLPDKVDNLVGNSIDWFHKVPDVQRKIFSNPANLPHKAIIDVGPEKLDLLVSAIVDSSGTYLGPMVSWEVVTDKVNLVDELSKSANDLGDAASTLNSVSSSLASGAEETSAQANTASVASEEVNAGVQTVATNMEEMVAAIKEITKTTNEASSMTNDAMKMAKNTNEIISQLGESSMDIGNVIKVISSIAQQTNLLALNATIEAARAGEAGKGFAVVANEVKELAKQTAKATADITKKIENIQSDSKGAVNAIKEISDVIEKVNGFTNNIAASVEEQAATTNEVTRIVTESAEGVKQINENILQVSKAAATTGKDAQSAQEASKSLGTISESLKGQVDKIKV